PSEWAKWCAENIAIDDKWNPRHCCMSPRGVWNLRMTDAHSRDIFFVAGARSMGIASRIDEVTGKTQYMVSGKWYDAQFESNKTESTAQQGVLQANYQATTYLDNPLYYSHFTLSKMNNGHAELQCYPEDASWQSVLKEGALVDAGNYLLTSGTRMANGSVLAHLQFVEVKPDSTTHIELNMRQSQDQLQVIGNFNSENLYYDLATAQTPTLLASTGRGYYVLALIDPNSEPTNHFLRDIAPYKEAFEAWGQKIVILFNDQEAATRFHKGDFANLPSTIVWGTDIDATIYNEIVANMKLQSPQRPIIIVADTFNRIVFISQGYSINLGEQLLKVIHQL
ncbi:MAG: transglutaminase domain-containing protein, partial [Bacteroidales bacterium]|nr:transglutaminase domain-containing protein [Bacteroidales bacterium]